MDKKDYYSDKNYSWKDFFFVRLNNLSPEDQKYIKDVLFFKGSVQRFIKIPIFFVVYITILYKSWGTNNFWVFLIFFPIITLLLHYCYAMFYLPIRQKAISDPRNASKSTHYLMLAFLILVFLFVLSIVGFSIWSLLDKYT